jgi:hypothetical protein
VCVCVCVKRDRKGGREGKKRVREAEKMCMCVCVKREGEREGGEGGSV